VLGRGGLGRRAKPARCARPRPAARPPRFERLLAAHPGRPVVVFTHAPPIGSGLKVVQNVHVKNRCAWLNHSDRPQRFLALVEKYGNVRLWFSGHFHLAQNYPDRW
jgi:hypothetical protein